MLPSAQFKELLDLTPYLKGREVISVGICFDGTLAVLVTEPDTKDLAFGRTEGAIGSFPLSKAKESFVTTLLRFGDSDIADNHGEKAGKEHEKAVGKTYNVSSGKTLVQEVELAPSESSYPQVQVFPDNSILVAHSRCSLRATGPELNATIYSDKGAVLRQFCLGDGIQDLRVSASGEIWVSYFDEGVCGNFGWTDDAIGAPGLNCFDAHGHKTWSYSSSERFGTIDDCYAMSLVGGDVVAYYYSDFPVIRIDKDKQIVGWENQVAGANAIAFSADKVLLFGGYDEPTRCVVQTLCADGTLSGSTQIDLQMPANFSGETVSGHNSELHVLVDSRWYCMSL